MPSADADGAPSGSADAWATAARRIADLARLDGGWDGDGAAPVSPAVIQLGLRATAELRRQGYEPPHDIYPAPDGGLFLEWQRANDVIERIECECDGHVQQMITSPREPARFASYDWLIGSRS